MAFYIASEIVLMGDEADMVKGTTIEEPGGGYRLRQVPI